MRNRTRTRRRPHEVGPNDVGTVWTMRRPDHAARCALLSIADGWELRVLVDGESLLSEQCSRVDEAFELAERWKRRMLDQGWQQVVPRLSGGAHDSRLA